MILIAILFAAFSFRRLRFSLKFFQQEGYLNGAFLRFIFSKGQLLDKRVFLPTALIAILPVKELWVQVLLASTVLALGFLREKNPYKASRKPLVKTPRARRIFWCAWILAIASAAWKSSVITLPILVLALPFILIISNIILMPVEAIIWQKYLRQARAKLAKFHPIVIGITGSFGKTSTKNILQHILSSSASSYATKRSINTLMGITRAVREELSQNHKYFIAEIGTSQKGRIREISKLVRPSFGIITAVAGAHFENFKTVEAIANEKFDMAREVAKNQGILLLNKANIPAEFIKKHAPKNSLLLDPNDVSNIKQSATGISFELNFEGKKYKISAPVFGIHQAQNISLAFILARKLGVSAENILLTLNTLPQTEHRLEVRREAGLTVIDDAFNSNIAGFLSALETLRALSKGRAILITPGMVELGSLHAEQHKEAGALANKLCDFIVVVKPARIRDFTAQIAPKKLIEVSSLKAAQEWLRANAKPGDSVLYENDLPDVYVEKISI